jgi:hypothetical protein
MFRRHANYGQPSQDWFGKSYEFVSFLPTGHFDLTHPTVNVEPVNLPQTTQIEMQAGESAAGGDAASATGPHVACATGRSDCKACAVQHGGTDESPASRIMTGWRFVLTSLSVFVVPLALAVAGACWFRDDPTHQLAAGVGGLCLGMALAGVTAKLMQRKSEANP